MGLRAHEGATGAAAAEGVRVSRQSDQMRARWADPAFRAKQAAALLGHAPNITGHYAPPDADAMRPYVEQVYGMLAGGAERGRKTG